MTLIRCCALSLGYEGKTVLQNCDFAVEQGDYLCIVGENGAGKSTLLRGILGLIRPLSGHVHFALPLGEVGYLPQQTPVQRDFPASVTEVVLSGFLGKKGLRPFYTREEKLTAQKNLKLLEAADLAHQCYRDLSGGQQQRVLLARALCATEKLLLMDEPFTGLDPGVSGELYTIIDRLNREDGITVLMVTHDVTGALEHAKHILHLGNEQYFGTVEAYRATPLCQKLMGGGADA